MSNSYIVRFWGKIFHVLRYISVFEYIRRLKPFRGSSGFVEAWVVGNLLLSFGGIILSTNTELPKLWASLFLAYCFIRIFEITVYQVNVLLFDQYKSPTTYEVKGYRRLVILLLHNYVEIIFWFAASYSILSNTFNAFEHKGTIVDMLLFSFMTMITFGSGEVKEISNIGHLVILNQSVIGLFMTMICLARFIGLLPKPRTMDPSEDEEPLLHDLTKEVKKLEEKIDAFLQAKHDKNQ